MRKHWFQEKYNHIPMSIKISADNILTKKLEAEKELELSKKLVDSAINYCSSILSEDNTAEHIESTLRKRFERLLQAYLLYFQLNDCFKSLLKPYANKHG